MDVHPAVCFSCASWILLGATAVLCRRDASTCHHMSTRYATHLAARDISLCTVRQPCHDDGCDGTSVIIYIAHAGCRWGHQLYSAFQFLDKQ
eukprot:303980-Chlamydomonas_euryale.AAC.11